MIWLKVLTVNNDIGFLPLDQLNYFEFETGENDEPIIRLFIKEVGDLAVKNIVVVSGDRVLSAIKEYLFKG